MTPTLPSFERCKESPVLADDFEGIVLNTPQATMLAEIPSLPIHGAFQFSQEAGDAIPGGPFRAIVILLVGVPGYHSFSFNATGQAILLEPDVTPGGKVRGYFNIDAFQMARLRPWQGRFFVSAYLGEYRTAPNPVQTLMTIKLG